MEELKHVIALLLEDAKRLQQLEPDAGTEARIWIAKEALLKSAELDFPGFAATTNGSQAFRQGLQECHCACR
ncbi:hypothetical protein LU631_12120 [Erwinia tracheiphila]|uniref:Uncharacterized protein n=1 Tax=Erwinia tracheiphila TaxID=65700 RepID=A0A0M2K9M2_9GAMM|nr:hypothetical protein [Erwinia tracheiphila]EOS93826.1 hypothetical protein ETR_17072 [Erwinia tracheiphila PSU-1]KKF35634.1 hypothetical protein SY86_09665 [Erwinia tracheiphila]KKF35965.1 hypothetical protein SY86_11865 [Erwinia tracheiphila]UIA87281.1 hypothetical protein LU631_21460 [Erwinia tracheiphila]UIA89807.1 hypothetical protein LU631_12120 [Erwinia tracheiphila]